MLLLLTSDALLTDAADKGVYSNESDQVIYSVHTPTSLSHHTFIYRTTADLQHRYEGPLYNQDGEPMALGDASGEETFFKLAEIEYHHSMGGSTIFRFGGREINEHDIFNDRGFVNKITYLHRARYFTGPDGREYFWTIGSVGGVQVELYLNDEGHTKVAEYHRRYHGVFHDRRPPALEIYPPGEHMADFIFITFLFAERLRVLKERKRTQQHTG